MTRQIIFSILFFFMILSLSSETFAQVGSGKRFLYIPIDNRPVNEKQTVEVAEKLGYKILVPPENFLGTGSDAENFGKPEELWRWLEDNAADADAAIISTDAMIYGSLVGSRQHELTSEEIFSRIKNFEQLHKNFPSLPVYAFGTIMRTPRSGTYSSAEPEYYAQYGAMIFNYTTLKDKSETEKISRREKKSIKNFENEIPAEVLDDWFKRREKNYKANEYLVDLTRAGVFKYFLLGCDDSAIFSQTHLESRHLSEYGKNLGKTVYQVMSGADELGMLMMSRAVNVDLHEISFVAAAYNDGRGKNTIPSYGNETIGESVSGAIIAVGGLEIPAPERADFVLAVNTNHDGKTFEASSPKNKINPRRGTRTFLRLMKNFLAEDFPVGVADVATSNGADNALMNQLKKNNLQFKIRAYGGWNTATNSSGFLIGAGVLTKFMDSREKNALLLTRYLDDWAYQSNIRTKITNGLIWSVPGEGNYSKLDGKREGLQNLTAELIKNFADENITLPAGSSLKNISAAFTWNRCFESDISFDFDE